jgi:phosphate transport system substrate-binding protein
MHLFNSQVDSPTNRQKHQRYSRRGEILGMAAALAWAISLPACSGNTANNGGSAGDNTKAQKLTLTGSSTVAPLVNEIAKRYENEHPGVRIDVQSGGSSRGMSDAQQGLSDIGMISRALKPEEQQTFQSFEIAKDGLGLIVHRDNPITSLTDAQVVDIYTDKINSWAEVGGKSAPITVVHKAEGRSTLELFLQHFELDNPQVKSDVVIGENQQGIKTIEGNPDGIGYVSIGAAEYAMQQGAPIRLLPMEGIVASTATVQDDTFPLTRPLNLVTTAPPTGLAQDFIQFAQSTAVYDIVRAQNFVPLEQTAQQPQTNPGS